MLLACSELIYSSDCDVLVDVCRVLSSVSSYGPRYIGVILAHGEIFRLFRVCHEALITDTTFLIICYVSYDLLGFLPISSLYICTQLTHLSIFQI